MATAADTIITKFNEFVAFIGGQPEQAQIDAWALNLLTTTLGGLPVPANVAPFLNLWLYSVYVDAGLTPPASLMPVAPKPATAQPLSLSPPEFTIPANTQVSETFQVSGGTEPYSVASEGGLSVAFAGAAGTLSGEAASSVVLTVTDSSTPPLTASLAVTA
jgi:hypothetical protein